MLGAKACVWVLPIGRCSCCGMVASPVKQAVFVMLACATLHTHLRKQVHLSRWLPKAIPVAGILWQSSHDTLMNYLGCRQSPCMTTRTQMAAQSPQLSASAQHDSCSSLNAIQGIANFASPYNIDQHAVLVASASCSRVMIWNMQILLQKQCEMEMRGCVSRNSSGPGFARK